MIRKLCLLGCVSCLIFVAGIGPDIKQALAESSVIVGGSLGTQAPLHPSAYAASEPEVLWLLQQIREFQPDVVIAIRAPDDLLDYDGLPTAPQRVGTLWLYRLGVFPGSLGGYAGIDLGIPVVTIELPYAGIMLSKNEIHRMWLDLIAWVHDQVAASVTDRVTAAG